MKTVRLFIVALFLTVAASAQPNASSARDGSSPTVYMISVQETDTLIPCEWRARAARNRMAMMDAVDDYNQTHRTGFQQPGRPQFLFAHKQNKYSLALGGFIALRTSYDFDGTPSATDFIPSSIPVPGDYASRQRLSMDASTSRIYLKGIANTRALGRVVVYVSTDFRGGAQGSYTPRLREAYVSFKGFTFGRDVTTFCDLDAGPTTIDFQGPNAYNFTFATMIRYEVPFANDHLKFGLAAELPSVSGTFGETFDPIPQRVPDFPVYFQYAWGAKRDSHFRVTGVVRDLYLHNAATGNNTSLLGWGVQASTCINLARVLTIYGNGVYGEGITNYIQDLSGLGYDFYLMGVQHCLEDTATGERDRRLARLQPRLLEIGGQLPFERRGRQRGEHIVARVLHRRRLIAPRAEQLLLRKRFGDSGRRGGLRRSTARQRLDGALEHVLPRLRRNGRREGGGEGRDQKQASHRHCFVNSNPR